MPPKKASEGTEEEKKDAGPKRPLPVWVYGINDHLEGPKELPGGFKRCLTLREDYLKLCAAVGAVAHPGLKARPKIPKPPPPGRRGSKDIAPIVLPGRRGSVTKSTAGAAAAAAAAAAQAALAKDDVTGKDAWGGRKDSKAGLEEKKEEKKPETEDPVLSVRSMLLDRVSVHLLGLLLPAATHIKVLVFSDCRLDVEMLRLLRDGLVPGTSVESLQIEWNPLEVPLPSEEDMKAEDEAKKAEAAAAAAAAAAAGDAGGDGSAAPVPEAVPDAEPPVEHYDLEVRERRRYAMQSQRTLLGFKERLADLFDGGLEEAFRVLEAPGDADQPLNYCDFQGVMEARLDISGPHIVSVFEVLDGPDYAGSEGAITLALLRQALEGLPDEAREGVDDPVGAALAGFFQPDTVLECLSLRACGISRLEIATMAVTLKQCPWTLKILNLWDNYLCDACAGLLGNAMEEYRGLEYVGLGRNRITDTGLAAICDTFNCKILDEAGLKTAQEQVKSQQAQIEAAEKAKAKAKAKAAPAPGDAKEKREPILYVDDLKESPAEEEGGECIWVFRRHTELKTLNVSENPIKDGRALEVLQMLGPEAELVLRGCPVSGQMIKKPDIAAKGRRASGVSGIPPSAAMDGSGWVLRMV